MISRRGPHSELHLKLIMPRNIRSARLLEKTLRKTKTKRRQPKERRTGCAIKGLNFQTVWNESCTCPRTSRSRPSASDNEASQIMFNAVDFQKAFNVICLDAIWNRDHNRTHNLTHTQSHIRTSDIDLSHARRRTHVTSRNSKRKRERNSRLGPHSDPHPKPPAWTRCEHLDKY